MSKTHYGTLAELAFAQRNRILNEALERRLFKYSTEALDSAVVKGSVEHDAELNIWARELDIVNRHITVDAKMVAEAADSYLDLGQHLVEKLNWPSDAIKVLPQGSTSTKTLVASPSAEKFDIDAVCQVDISKIEAKDPMAFFDDVGKALKSFETEPMKRCWRIHYNEKSYYIDFTPSIPLSTVPETVRAKVKYGPTTRYHKTALAVVDCPTKEWKTSNPEGFAAWINDQSDRQVLRLRKYAVEAMDSANVAPVPDQEVPLSDTLRVAIRLFKRHRDMAVRRGLITNETKPISVIIVTLLTQAYEGLADLNRTYSHPIELLCDLAEMLPNMPEKRDGRYEISNPTVHGENFAEKWNEDDGTRARTFLQWCKLLATDMTAILDASDPVEIRKRVHHAFGTNGADRSSGASGGSLSGLAAAKPTTVTLVQPTRGLA
ncbi:nucleotidyltransferase domain-containing protein [Undibacterium sp. WLHG33]|uniref:nucleotidyltransferase domain-containing protein n=1 Tax=Undibacterium sp. WLHG33 TaxID=3412482 RepID=UPI003C2CAE6C